MKRLKMFVSILLIICLFSLVTACSNSGEEGSSEGSEVQRLKLGHTLSDTSSWQLAAEEYAEKIKERTDGRYEIDIFPEEQLSSGNQQKALEMLQTGTTDIDIKSTIIYSGIEPRLSILNMPWLMPTEKDVDDALEGQGGEYIFNLLKETGVVPIAMGETGFRQMTNNKHHLIEPADFKGLKMRVPGMNLYLDLYSELGSDPTVLNFSEVFTALQQNTIDGMEGVTDVILTSRFYEVQEYLTINNYSIDLCVLAFSPKFYDSLSEEDKKIFEDTGREVMQNQKEYARKTNIEALEALKNEMDVRELTPEEVSVLQEACIPVYEKHAPTFGEEALSSFGYELK